MTRRTAKEFLESKGCYERAKTLEYWQTVPYKHKVAHAKKLVYDFFEHPEVKGNCCISVGGLDSITLTLMIRSMGFTAEQIPAVSVSSLEDKSIQRVHKAIGVQTLKPCKSKRQVIEEYGYPIISKEIANRIRILQNPSPKNATIRHAMITGETGHFGGDQKDSRMKLAEKWLKLFGGADPEGAELGYKVAPFAVSDQCCFWLKEKPMQDYQKETGRFPYLGLMASEGGRRAFALKHWGCNYVSPTVKRSAPFASFMRDDVLRLALEMDDYYQNHWAELNPDPEQKVETIIPEIYGQICETGGGIGDDESEENRMFNVRFWRATRSETEPIRQALRKQQKRVGVLHVHDGFRKSSDIYRCRMGARSAVTRFRRTAERSVK